MKLADWWLLLQLWWNGRFPRRRERKRNREGRWRRGESGAPLKLEWDTQQWHANPLGWWLGVGEGEWRGWKGRNEMMRKKNAWQLFDVSAFWFCLSAVLCKWQQLCQSGGICPICGRVMGDYTLMLRFRLDLQRDTILRRFLIFI